MARVFITGSASGLGRNSAEALLDEGHEVVIHARTERRLRDASDLVDRGALAVAGDLASQEQTRGVATQVNDLGAVDAVIHNAGVNRGADIFAINVVAPYLLTALIPAPRRLVYLSSGMHFGGRAAALPEPARRGGRGGSVGYSDSKLFVTAFAAAVARLWPGVLSNAVDPGWVATRMGGPGASDDLELGHVTQNWLATSTDPEAQTTGRYWYHQRPRPPHEAAGDQHFQDELLTTLTHLTDVPFPQRPA